MTELFFLVPLFHKNKNTKIFSIGFIKKIKQSKTQTSHLILNDAPMALLSSTVCGTLPPGGSLWNM